MVLAAVLLKIAYTRRIAVRTISVRALLRRAVGGAWVSDRRSPAAGGRGSWVPRLLRQIHENIIITSMFTWPRGAGSWELFSALNYTLCVNIMQLWSLCQLVTGWGCGRGCGHVPACLSSFFSSSVSHNEIGHKQSLLLGALRFIYIWLFQSAFHSAIGEEEVTSRPLTRCCLAIVCLGRKVNEKAAAVDGECVLYWVSDITQYNINTKSYLLGTE